MRNVKYILPARAIDMGGFPVKQALPTQRVDQVDPYLLLHHAHVKFDHNRPAKHQGVGPHPHRGFSPVTFILEGEIHHRDSFGHSQIAKAGEVQWMHAGKGVIHSERPSDALVTQSGRQDFIQLWINSPAANKLKIPTYQHLTNDHMPTITSEDHKVTSKLVVGDYNGITGPAESQSETLILWSTAQIEGNQTFDIPNTYNTTLYTAKGAVNIQGHGIVGPENLVVFDNNDTTIEVTGKSEPSTFFIFAGVPIDEEVTQYGPYVMNTQTEILEAMRDYQMGKMGILIEE